MNTKEAKTLSASCFWSADDAPIEKEREFADRFFVDRDVVCDPSKREFILDAAEDEKGTENYRLRCCLYKYCVELVNSIVRNEVSHTTNQSVSLLQEFIRLSFRWVLNRMA